MFSRSGAKSSVVRTNRLKIEVLQRSSTSYSKADLNNLIEQWTTLLPDSKKALLALVIMRRPREPSAEMYLMRLRVVLLALRDKIKVDFKTYFCSKDAYNEISTIEAEPEKRLLPVTPLYALYALGERFTHNIPICIQRFKRLELTKTQIWRPVIEAVMILSSAIESNQFGMFPADIKSKALAAIRQYLKEIPEDCYYIKVNNMSLYQAAFVLGDLNTCIEICCRLFVQHQDKLKDFEQDFLVFYARTCHHAEIARLSKYSDALIVKMDYKALSKLMETLVKQKQYHFLEQVLICYLKDLPGGEASVYVKRYLSYLARQRNDMNDHDFMRPPSPVHSGGDEPHTPKHKGSKKKSQLKNRTSTTVSSSKKPKASNLRSFDEFLLETFDIHHGSHKGAKKPSDSKAPSAKNRAIAQGMHISHNTRFVHEQSIVKPLPRKGQVPAAFSFAALLAARHSQLDSRWASPLIAQYTKHDCIVFYRGVHWLRSGFSEDVSEPTRDQIDAGVAAHLKRIKAAPSDLLSQHLLRLSVSEQSEALVQLSAWYASTKARAIPADLDLSYKAHARYPSLNTYVQSYFSNNYDGFCESARRGDRQLGLDGVALKGHPFVCFSESDPEHALKYAYGQKTASNGHYHDDRLRPRYQKDRKPLNPFVGEISAVVMTLDELAKRPHADIWHGYARYHYATNARIVSERECSFVGSVPKEFIVLSQSVSWPNFVGPWYVKLQREYGLSEIQYNECRQSLDESLEKIEREGDRSAYKAFKNKLGNILIAHHRRQLQKRVREMLELQKASLVCRSPEGLTDTVPAELDWLTFLRYLHQFQAQLTALVKQPEAILFVSPHFKGLMAKVSYNVKMYLALLLETKRVDSLSLTLPVRVLLAQVLPLYQKYQRSLAGDPPKVPPTKKESAKKAPPHKAREDVKTIAPALSAPLPEPISNLKRLHTASMIPLDESLKRRLILMLSNQRIDALERQKSVLMRTAEGLAFWQNWLRDYRDIDGRFVLHHIAGFGRLDWFAILFYSAKKTRITKGVRSVDQDALGNIPLHLAAQNGHAEMVSKLLKYHMSAYADRSNNAGYTPLQLAVRGGHNAAVMALLEHHCDLLVRGKAGVSALDILKDEALKAKMPMIHAFAQVLLALKKVVEQWDNLYFCLSDDNTQLAQFMMRLNAFIKTHPSHQALLIDHVGKLIFSHRNLAYLCCRDACFESVKLLHGLGLQFYGLNYQNRKAYHGVAPFTVALVGYVSKHRVYRLKQASFLKIMVLLLDTHSKLLETMSDKDTALVIRTIRKYKLKSDFFIEIKEKLKSQCKKKSSKKRSPKVKIEQSWLVSVAEAVAHWSMMADDDIEMSESKAASRLAYFSSDPFRDFQAAVRDYGLELHNVLNDGNCFFHAVFDQLQTRYPDKLAALQAGWNGELINHESLRNIASGALMRMALNGELEGFVDAPEAHIEKLSADREWADGLIIASMARVLGLSIVLINNDGAAPTTINAGCDQVIFLGYEVGLHFQSARGVPNAALQAHLAHGEAGAVLPLAQAKSAFELLELPAEDAMVFRKAKSVRTLSSTYTQEK